MGEIYLEGVAGSQKLAQPMQHKEILLHRYDKAVTRLPKLHYVTGRFGNHNPHMTFSTNKAQRWQCRRKISNTQGDFRFRQPRLMISPRHRQRQALRRLVLGISRHRIQGWRIYKTWPVRMRLQTNSVVANKPVLNELKSHTELTLYTTDSLYCKEIHHYENPT